MFKLSRRLDYAILAVAHLASRARTAEHSGSSSGSNASNAAAPLSARALADATRVPPAILANILKDLTRLGIVRSARGVHGGYELAIAPEELSIGALVRALEGEVRFVECVPLLDAALAAQSSTCQIESTCPVKAPLRRVHERIQEVLDSLTFDQLLAESLLTPAPR